MPKEQDLFEDLKSKALSSAAREKLNISFPQYLTGVKEINSIRAAPNLGGYVRKQEPQVVYLNEESVFEPVSTLGHEATHVAQNLASQEKPDPENKYKYSLGIGGPMMAYDTNKMTQIYKNAENVYKEYKDKNIFSSEFPRNQKEMMADLQGLEAALPKGQTILDTDIGKKMFPTPELQHFYLVSSLPYTTKMLEYEPSMFQVAASKARTALQTFKDEAIYKSYADAAMSAFMKLVQK